VKGVGFRSVAVLCTVAAVVFGLASAQPGAADSTPAVPYQLPVQLPASTTAPPVAATAPYTPAVLSLISQLLPTPTPTAAQVANASTLLHDGSNSTCNAVGPVGGPVGLDSSGNPTATTLAAAAAAGATNIKVASVTGFTAGETIWIDLTSSAEQVTIADVGTAGSTGTGIDLTAPLTKSHASGRAVYVTLTNPSITKLCWADAQGINPTGGPSGPGGGAPNGQTLTTSPNEILGDASTFDRRLMNVWGQTEATEGRELMMTGLFGPQTDLNRLPNWGRGHQTGGEDPFLSGTLVGEQINGIQAKGFMSEMKHFLMYNGENQNGNSDVQDQAAHELYFTPYEHGFIDGRAAATMCSYQIWRDVPTPNQGDLPSVLTQPTSALNGPVAGYSPYASADGTVTWPLDESHFSCEQPLSLSYVLRQLWGSDAMVGTDYPAQHSTSGVVQGMEQEMPTTNGFNNGGNGTNDPTGSTCAYTTAATSHTPGDWAPCNDTSDPVSHVGGIPNHFEGSAGTGCPAPTSTTGAGGCTLNAAVVDGVVSMAIFKQALARVLYQQDRFGMLGCDPTPTPICTSPGGINGDRSGNALIPTGPAAGASPTTDLGTENGDAGVAELTAEEGSVLFKNDSRGSGSGPALPIRSSDLTANNIFVTGPGAEYLIASPSREASQGFPNRIAVNPLSMLQSLSGHSDAFDYLPALSPTGEPVPSSALRTPSDTPGLSRTTGTGSPTTDSSLDFTAVNGNQLGSASTAYTWTGCLFVPAGGDTYTLRVQNTPGSTVAFALSTDAVGTTGTTTLSAASAVGAVNIKVASVSGFAAGQTIKIDTGANQEADTVTAVGTAGAGGTGLTLGSPLTLAHASGSTVALAGPDSAGEGTSTTSCSAAWATLGSGSPTGRTLSNATTFYNGQYQGNVPVTVTNAGYTDAGLQNRQFAVGSLTPASGEYYALKLTDTTPATSPSDFRFGWSRTNGDIADAAAAAKGKGLAIVFANDQGVPAASGPTSIVAGIGQNYVNLINAVAAANPNTIVVLQSAYADTVSDWLPNVKAMLEGWNSGQEGSVALARLLLGQANPSGHTAMTWPANPNDDIWGYNETTPLYPGDSLGTHPERLNGLPGGASSETEGIYTGYRFFDKEGITPQFAFGFGLSYSDFSMPSNWSWGSPAVTPTADGGLDVKVRIRDGNSVPGTEVVQAYVGAPVAQAPGVQYAVRSLAQFTRVAVPATSAGKPWTNVTLHIDPRALSHWSQADQRWVRDPGTRTIYVGDADSLDHLMSTNVIVPPTPGSAGFECSNVQIDATEIDGDVNVPAGSWCDLTGDTVTGTVVVHGGATGLRIDSSTVNAVQIGKVTTASDPQSDGQNDICGDTFAGQISWQGSDPSSPIWNVGGCGANTYGGPTARTSRSP